ncbi:MAG: LD-carboxypeptidase [Agathobacter sp.]|nr:LD-carboxypeptidase [Agathobacter sp.]
MRYPKFLQKDGTIGFVAPSFGCNIEPYRSSFQNALDRFKELGYGLDLGPNCFEGKGIGISNTPKECAKELMEYYASEKNNVLMSCGGGELMCEVLSYMDFEALSKEEPKWYMGYSDNTNFTFLSTTLMDTAAVYGPCAPAFGMEPWHESLSDAWKLLCGEKDTVTGYELWEKEGGKDEEHPLLPYNVTEPTIIRRFPDEDVSFSGRLIGGCMDCLVNLTGTRFDKVKEFTEKYKEDGFIWFLESCELNVMSIRRAIWQMKEAGWFSHVKGFLIGRPLCFGEEMFGCDQYQAVTDLLGEYQVPIIMDTDIGHLAPMMPVVSGSTADVKVEGNHIEITYTYK